VQWRLDGAALAVLQALKSEADDEVEIPTIVDVGAASGGNSGGGDCAC
jgi:hypothetical protein